jgi:hypothetical protein
VPCSLDAARGEPAPERDGRALVGGSASRGGEALLGVVQDFDHLPGRCDQRGGTSATSPGNRSAVSSSGIPYEKSAFAKNRSKFRDLNSHLIPRLYPYFSEV